MAAPAYASCVARPNGALTFCWCEQNDLVFSDSLPEKGERFARHEFDSPALFVDIAADNRRVLAVWQNHGRFEGDPASDDCMVTLDSGESWVSILGKCHGTMCVAARLHPETQLFHVWWLEQVVRLDAQGREVKTTEQLGHWIEGVGSKLTSLPPHLAWDAVKREGGTSQGIRDVEFVDGEFRVRFMDDERSRFV